MGNYQDSSKESILSAFLGSQLLEDNSSLYRSLGCGSEILTSRGLGTSFVEMYSRDNTEDWTQTWAVNPMLVYIYLVYFPENNCPAPSPQRLLLWEWQPVHWSNMMMGRRWLMFSRVPKCIAETTVQALHSITFSSIYKFCKVLYLITF